MFSTTTSEIRPTEPLGASERTDDLVDCSRPRCGFSVTATSLPPLITLPRRPDDGFAHCREQLSLHSLRESFASLSRKSRKSKKKTTSRHGAAYGVSRFVSSCRTRRAFAVATPKVTPRDRDERRVPRHCSPESRSRQDPRRSRRRETLYARGKTRGAIFRAASRRRGA